MIVGQSMICRRISEMASLHIDGLLTPDQSRAFEEHLAACPYCERRTEELKRVVGLIGNMGQVRPPAHLKSLVAKRIAVGGKRSIIGEVISLCRDLMLPFYRLEKREVLVGLLALPLSVLFFVAILSQMYMPLKKLDPNERFLAYTIRTQRTFDRIDPLLRRPGSARPPRRTEVSMPAMIGDRHLEDFAYSAFQAETEDSFSVVTYVRRDGQAEIKQVIEYPHDSRALKKLNSLLTSVRFQPATHKGKTVDSYLILIFSKINVLG